MHASEAGDSWARRFKQWMWAFVATPASARPLACLRIGLAAVLLLQALALRSHLTALYGSLGIVQLPIVEAMALEGVPRVDSVVAALAPLGLDEGLVLRLMYALYLGTLAGLLLGWHTRLMALAAWLIHLTLKSSSPLSAYGVYEFSLIGLFYCVWLPAGHAWSLDRWLGRVDGKPSADSRLGLRVLQVHLCIIYLASGLEKAMGPQWWSGEAIWRALMRRDFGQFDFSWLAEWPWLAQIACWSTLFIEVGYAVLIWPRRTRTLMVLATIGLHVDIALTMGLWSFAAVMIVLNVSAFLIEAAPIESPGAADCPVALHNYVADHILKIDN